MASNALEIKERILNFLERRGPSLPVHIAKETGLSILFASAFLSEILSEKKIKMSYMRIGASPLYFLPGQETFLENFSHTLKKKEKEAFVALKEQRFLKDAEVEPAIRVALREIRDFAVPFQNEEGIFWRYYKIPESEFYEKKKQEELRKIERQQEKIYTQEISNISHINAEKIHEIQETKREQEIQEDKDEKMKITPRRVEVGDIFDKSSKSEKNAEKGSKKTEKKKTAAKKEKKPEKKSSQKSNASKFFNRVKTYLSEKEIEILDIEEATNTEIALKVRENQKEYLIVAYSKKKITEQEITKAHKKSVEMQIPYKILALGEPLKKLDNLIEAIKDLQGIEKVD